MSERIEEEQTEEEKAALMAALRVGRFSTAVVQQVAHNLGESVNVDVRLNSGRVAMAMFRLGASLGYGTAVSVAYLMPKGSTLADLIAKLHEVEGRE